MSERLYTIMTDSRRLHDKTLLARIAPKFRTSGGRFWTHNDPEVIWGLPYKEAKEVLAGLGHNNPRIVRLEKAIKLITAQRDAAVNPVSPLNT